MIGEKHDLAHELPEFKEKIHELKLSNRHFQKLFDNKIVRQPEIQKSRSS